MSKMIIKFHTDMCDAALSIYKNISEQSSWDEMVLISTIEVLVTGLEPVTRETIDSMPNLKVIAHNTTGTNHIDLPYIKNLSKPGVVNVHSRVIKVINLKGETEFLNTVTATAEHTIGLMIALLRKYKTAFEWSNEQHSRDMYKGNDLKDLVIGILGFGRIGKQVSHISRALGMTMNIWSEGVTTNDTFEAFLDSIDILSIHVPLDDTTMGMITRDHLKQFGGWLINTSRGEVIERDALYEALSNDELRGAAIDVMHHEDKGGDKKLIALSQTFKESILVLYHGSMTYGITLSP